MSMLLMVQAMKAKVGNPLRKLVLIKLADQANDDGKCWPSYQSIADACEISRRTVITHIDWLEDNGFLKRDHRKSNDGLSRSNVFVLTIDDSENPAPRGENPAPRGENPAPRGENPAPRGENPAPPGGANAAPGSANAAPIETVNESINIESVKESVKESVAHEPTPPAKTKRFIPMNELLDRGVDAQVAADWLAVRKAKRAPLTKTALDRVIREADKAGISLSQAVQICAARGWQGFQASWNWQDGRTQGRWMQELSPEEQVRQQALRIAKKMGLTAEQVGVYDAKK